MANWYTSSLAGGGGSGSEGDPWTLAEAVSAINALTVGVGDTVWIKADGTYTTAGAIITATGGGGAIGDPKFLKGYSSVIGDGGLATIQRSGGAGYLLQCPLYWHVENLVLDGQNSGTYNLYGASTQVKRVESKNAGSSGFFACWATNCYSHDNAVYGFESCIMNNCTSKDCLDGWYKTSAINSVSVGMTRYGVYLNSSVLNLINCNIEDCGNIGVKSILLKTTILNCSFSNVAGSTALEFLYASNNVNNNNFYNITGSLATDLTQLGTYYELDPQFTDPSSLDFTRSGSNLDDLGLSTVGMQAFDYSIDIGIDQKPATDYPNVNDVRNLVVFENGNSIGNMTLPPSGKLIVGTNCGTNGTEIIGSYTETPVGKVIDDTSFGEDGTEKTGTYKKTPVGKVINDTSFGENGTEETGTYVATPVNKVIDDTSFGANSEDTGTYKEVIVANVVQDVTYGANSENTGTYTRDFFVLPLNLSLDSVNDYQTELENLVRGDSLYFKFTIDTDLTDWKLRAELHDDTGGQIKRANTASGGGDAQIEVLSATASESTFLIKIDKNLTTNFDDKAYLEIEIEDDSTPTRLYTVGSITIGFVDEKISWETP